MEPQQLRAVLRRKPFVPFRIHVLDGSSYDIKHPDGVWLTRRTAYIGIPTEADFPELGMLVDILHISRVEDLPASTVPGNGAVS